MHCGQQQELKGKLVRQFEDRLNACAKAEEAEERFCFKIVAVLSDQSGLSPYTSCVINLMHWTSPNSMQSKEF